MQGFTAQYERARRKAIVLKYSKFFEIFLLWELVFTHNKLNIYAKKISCHGHFNSNYLEFFNSFRQVKKEIIKGMFEFLNCLGLLSWIMS